jgi:hypothetical protein
VELSVNKVLAENRIDALNDPQSLKRLENIEDARLRADAVAHQLETVFFGMVIKAMRATVPDGGIDGRGLGRSQYVQMLDEQYAALGGMPRDPRFHEALVREILGDADGPQRLIEKLQQAQQFDRTDPATVPRQAPSIPPGEAQASRF